jgi:Cu(I)/Ag(I) efflux system membrane protein CusA/SilA
LRHRALAIGANVAFFIATIPLAFTIGSQFMPPLYEGSILFMPTTPAGISITQATELLQTQDRILKSFPEVESVFGTVGRSDSATDNNPLDMFMTIVMLKPRSQWRSGMTYDRLIQEMDAATRFPGVTNTWTMPIQGRIDMVLTGVKTPVGLKIQGPDLDEIQRIGAEIEELLAGVDGTRGVFAERVSQGFYVNIDVNRAVAAQYGLTVGDVQLAIASAVGGENVTTAIDGRNRFPVNVRYLADYRSSPEALGRVLLMTPAGAQIPLSEVAKVAIAPGPSMIRDEGGELTGYVFLDLSTSDYGGYVARAQSLLDSKLRMPPGYGLEWTGQYAFALRARERLMFIVPIVFATIFVLLYTLFRSSAEALVLLVPCFYALSGGLLLQYLMGFNYSVAVAVGYIALFGIAVETGVVMVTYLHEALDDRLRRGPIDRESIKAAAIDGAVLRLRPKLMTVATVMLSLTPVLWDTGVGSDIMKPIAAPIIGGMVTSTVHVLILVPVFFAMMKEHAFRRGTLGPSTASGG